MCHHLDFSFVIPTVSTVASKVKKMVADSQLPILVVEGEKERHDAFNEADVAIAASGTVALELAIVGVPHIIAYKVPKITEWLVRHLIHIQFVNLSNILLGREIVPELLQDKCTPQNIIFHIEQLLEQKDLYIRQQEGFAKVQRILGMGEQTPSDNAAAAILHLLEKK